MTLGPRPLIDLRWLGANDGTGRVCHHLLDGLSAQPPPTEVTLWGDPLLIASPPERCTVAATNTSGNRLGGQSHFMNMPPHSSAIYLNQVRPLRDWNSATVMHDTIQIRLGNEAKRAIKLRFLRTVARRSKLVATVSEHSRRTLVSDLGCDPTKIRRLHLPIDRELAARVIRRRAELAPKPDDVAGQDILYVGQAKPHKNLDGLLRAFNDAGLDGSRRLHLLGPNGDGREQLEQLADDIGLTSFVVADDRSDEALIDAYARAGTVVMPSLEEGWGLPAFEAVAAGIPVVSSLGGALPEVAEFATAPFNLIDVAEPGALAAALADAPAGLQRRDLDRFADAASRSGPAPVDLAAQILDLIAELQS